MEVSRLTNFKLFSGNANLPLSLKIAEYLKTPISNALVGQFSDGETRIEIKDDVRNQNVFILQSTSNPVNQHLMELLLMADAIRRASAKYITAVIPYFGYARQDQCKSEAQVPISAKVIADLLASVGIQRIVTVDIHAGQLQGFFSTPLDNIDGLTIFLKDIQQQNNSNPMIVSPDIGGVLRARAFAKLLEINDLAIIDKRRPHPNEAQVMHLIGNVKNRHCVIIDDMVDTGETLCLAAKTLKDQGAKNVIAYATHPVLSGSAIQTIRSSALDALIVSDTIPLNQNALDCPLIRQLSIAPIIAEAILKLL